MILVHVFQTDGQRATVTLDGTDRAEAREFCHAIVACEGPAYRACIYDALSQRYQFDTDDAWLTQAAA